MYRVPGRVVFVVGGGVGVVYLWIRVPGRVVDVVSGGVGVVYLWLRVPGGGGVVADVGAAEEDLLLLAGVELEGAGELVTNHPSTHTQP